MDLDDVVLIDAAEQLRKFEDETAQPYFAQHKPPHLGIGKNIDVVPMRLQAVPEVTNGACHPATNRGSFRCYYEDAKRACYCLLR